jgi:hypothetical protein
MKMAGAIAKWYEAKISDLQCTATAEPMPWAGVLLDFLNSSDMPAFDFLNQEFCFRCLELRVKYQDFQFLDFTINLLPRMRHELLIFIFWTLKDLDVIDRWRCLPKSSVME